MVVAGAAAVVAGFAVFFFDVLWVVFLVEPVASVFDASAFMASDFIGAGVAGAAGAVPWAYAVAAKANAHRAVKSFVMTVFILNIVR